MAKRNTNIDLFKYIASIMIIAVHTLGADSAIAFFALNVLCRTAVPFFAVCSGYYLSSDCQLGCHDRSITDTIKRQERKLCKQYVIWSFVYLIHSIPMWIRIGWFSFHAFIDYGIAAVYLGSHYHLWYILDLIYMLPLFAVLIYSCKQRFLCIISVFFWFGKSVTFGYRELFPDTIVHVFSLVDHIPGLLSILPLLLLGSIIRKESTKSRSFYLTGLVISFCVLCTEAFILKSHGQYVVSYIFFTYPTAYFLFHVLLSLRQRRYGSLCALLGKISILVYCVHPIFVEITENLGMRNGSRFAIALIGSTVFGLIVIFAKKKLEVKKCFV